MLCVALVGFLVWIFREPRKAELPTAPATAKAASVPVAPVPTPSTPPPIVKTPAPAPAPVKAIDPEPRQAPAAVAEAGVRPVQTILETQIALARLGISPGSIDGVAGGQTHAALLAFQAREGITLTGTLDTDTKALLNISLPATTNYIITAEDLARLMPVPKTWLEKSQQPRLDFETIVELLGEKGFCSPQCVRTLNPGINWSNVTAGTIVTLPVVSYPPAANRMAFIRISLQDRQLEAFDAQSNLLAHFPCSIGRLAAKRPAGELHVAAVAIDPNYTFDPAVFPESAEAQSIGHKLIIPPGPNNPVGVAWIGLDKPGYGIHGTPSPEQVGRTESHGCFRLANWNAAYLAHIVWIGMPVIVE